MSPASTRLLWASFSCAESQFPFSKASLGKRSKSEGRFVVKWGKASARLVSSHLIILSHPTPSHPIPLTPSHPISRPILPYPIPPYPVPLHPIPSYPTPSPSPQGICASHPQMELLLPVEQAHWLWRPLGAFPYPGCMSVKTETQ